MKQRILNATPERIHPILKGLYYSIYPKKKGTGRSEDPYEMVRNTTDCDSPVVIDGGAYDGRTTIKFQELFDNPIIHAIEPVPSHVEMFREKLQSEYRGMKSEEKAKKYQTEKKLEVKQTRIDNLVDEVDIIKLDLQGYELPALRGATDILDNCKAIITEVEFVPYYENQPLFSEVDVFLSERDFQLFNFSHLRIEPDGQLATTDAVYLHKDVYRYNDNLIYNPERHK